MNVPPEDPAGPPPTPPPHPDPTPGSPVRDALLRSPDAGALAARPRRRDAGAVDEVCPYLVAASGGWRSAYASREHRCAAVRPAAVLAPGKQRSLCLGEAHLGCATYVAARELTATAGAGSPAGGEPPLWPRPRTLPLLLEPTRGRLPAVRSGSRAGGQVLLIGLMVVAFVVLALARAVGPGPAGTATPGPSPAASMPTPSPSTSPAPTASPTIAPSVTPASSPTSSPTASPTAAATATSYRVKAGDTLSAIAAQFGVSVTAIAEANGITNPSLIRIGQVLVIPAP